MDKGFSCSKKQLNQQINDRLILQVYESQGYFSKTCKILSLNPNLTSISSIYL